jgi:hypothetical protein
MRIRFGSLLAAAAILALSAPAWAHRLGVSLDLSQAARIEGKQLPPGHDRLVANDKSNNVKIFRHDNLVATVDGHWVHKRTKPPYTDVILTKNQVSEIDFSGKTEAILFR